MYHSAAPHSYVDGLKIPEDYVDPEAEASDAILSRKSRSLLAAGTDRRRTRKGKGQDKGDHKYLITDPKNACIYVYTEKITGKLFIYQEKEVDNKKVLKLIDTKNITVTPNNAEARNNCPDLKKAKTSGSIVLQPFNNEAEDKGFKVEIKLDFDVFRGRYWELTSRSQINVTGSQNHQFKIHHPEEITAGTTFSFSCQSLNIKSTKAKLNGTRAELKLSFARFQVQPYETFKQNGKQKVFRPSFDCSTWFTVPLWTGFLVVLLFTAILAMGVVALLDIKTMDRFENPKGKTITVAAAND